MADLHAFEHSEGVLVVDSRLIAPRLGIAHKNFLATIDKFAYKMAGSPVLKAPAFQTRLVQRRQGGSYEERWALLTEPQANFLMSLSRNTEQVVQCKLELAEAFEKAKALLRQRKLVDATLQVYLQDNPAKRSDRGRVFQEEFYEAIYLLKGWNFVPGKTRHPVQVAHITIDAIYKRLQPEVWEELTKKNPRLNGKRKYCCHQFLTENIGNPHLRHHLYAVTKLMRASRSWEQFMYDLNRIHPRTKEVQLDILFELFAHSPDEGDRWKRLAS